MNLYSVKLPELTRCCLLLLRGSGKLSDPAGPVNPALRAAAGGRYGMSRVYGEPVEVQARDDGRPVRFVWRSRLYTVRAILEHWVINREWWREPAAEPGQPELEFWRVEAAPGQGMTPGVYELRREIPVGTWTLRRGI
jgi:hypothetical protein